MLPFSKRPVPLFLSWFSFFIFFFCLLWFQFSEDVSATKGFRNFHEIHLAISKFWKYKWNDRSIRNNTRFFNNGSLFYFHEDIIVIVTTYYLKPESHGQPRILIQPNGHISNYKKRFSGPLHMSPVDWAGPVFQDLALPLNPLEDDRAGWLGSRDLRFSNWDLGKVF